MKFQNRHILSIIDKLKQKEVDLNEKKDILSVLFDESNIDQDYIKILLNKNIDDKFFDAFDSLN